MISSPDLSEDDVSMDLVSAPSTDVQLSLCLKSRDLPTWDNARVRIT